MLCDTVDLAVAASARPAFAQLEAAHRKKATAPQECAVHWVRIETGAQCPQEKAVAACERGRCAAACDPAGIPADERCAQASDCAVSIKAVGHGACAVEVQSQRGGAAAPHSACAPANAAKPACIAGRCGVELR